jgi:hypothetical protein
MDGWVDELCTTNMWVSKKHLAGGDGSGALRLPSVGGGVSKIGVTGV